MSLERIFNFEKSRGDDSENQDFRGEKSGGKLIYSTNLEGEVSETNPLLNNHKQYHTITQSRCSKRCSIEIHTRFALDYGKIFDFTLP